MRWLTTRIRPTKGAAQALHIVLILIMPLVLLALVRLQGGFVQVALSLVLLSKWRMFAVRPRFWLANIRANAVDITVGLSVVLFMASSPHGYVQLVWMALYIVWLLAIKPGTSPLLVAGQAWIALLAGLSVLFLEWADAPLALLVVGAGLVCYIAAHHFFDAFDEPYSQALSWLWGYLGAAMTWVLGHWLLFYGVIAQPTLVMCLISYGLAVLYYFDHRDKLSAHIRAYTIFTIMASIVVVLLATWALGEWSNKVV